MSWSTVGYVLLILLGIVWALQIVVILVFAIGVLRGKPHDVDNLDVDDDDDQTALPPQWQGRSIEEITHLRLIDPEKLRRSPAIRFVNAVTTVLVPFVLLLVLPWILGSIVERFFARRG